MHEILREVVYYWLRLQIVLMLCLKSFAHSCICFSYFVFPTYERQIQ